MMTLLPTPWELELVDRKFLASHNQIHQPTCFHIRIYCVHGWSFCFYLFALSTCSLDLFPLTVSRSHFCFAAVPISLSSLACCHCHCYTHGKPPPCNPTSPSSYCSIYLLVFTVTNWKYFLGYGLHSVFFFFFSHSLPQPITIGFLSFSVAYVKTTFMLSRPMISNLFLCYLTSEQDLAPLTIFFFLETLSPFGFYATTHSTGFLLTIKFSSILSPSLLDL